MVERATSFQWGIQGGMPPSLAAWQLHQYCENGLQMENKSQEILHHLGTRKDAKLCHNNKARPSWSPVRVGVVMR